MKIMLEFFQNLLKFVKNQSKIGSRRVLGPLGGPFREARRPRDWFLIDFEVIWGSILGPIWEIKFINIVKKSIWSDSESLKTLNTLLDGLQHWFLIDFGRHWAPNRRCRVENMSQMVPKCTKNVSKKGSRQGVWFRTRFVQNHPIFEIDFKDFTVATKSEKHWKIYEKRC